MSGGYAGRVSRAGNIIVNPSGASANLYEVALRDGPWWILDLSPVNNYPNQRGSNVIIDGVPGQRAYARQVDETTYTMPLQVTGEVNASGSTAIAPSALLETLQDNLDYLWENVFSQSPISATRSCIRVRPNGAEEMFEAQFSAQIGRWKGHEAWVAVDMTVPSGRIG